MVGRLAEAIPAEKYGWRPGPGVRSVSEVLMHTASGELLFFVIDGYEGRRGSAEESGKECDREDGRGAMAKASFEAVQQNYPKIDKQKAVKFLGHDATCEGVLLRALAHANEHLGQMIAYARVNGVVPPWSK